MFTLSSSKTESICDSFYKSLNSINLSESDAVEFVDGTDIDTNDKPIIRGRLRLTSAPLAEDVAVDLRKAVGVDTNVDIRIEVEPTITVGNIKQNSLGDWQLIDTDSIEYTISDSNPLLCILTKANNQNEDGYYNVDDWDRHDLEALYIVKGVIGYLDGSLFDDITEPLVQELINYHNKLTK